MKPAVTQSGATQSDARPTAGQKPAYSRRLSEAVLRKAGRDGLTLFALLVSLLLGPGAPLFINVANAQSPQTPIQQNQLDQLNRPGDLRRAPDAAARISERQAANLARQRFSGTILRITLIGEGNTQQYQIRMENEGRVFTVFVHAFTGRISGGS